MSGSSGKRMQRPARAILLIATFLTGATAAAVLQYLWAARDPASCIQEALAAAYASPSCIQPTHFLSLDLIAGALVAAAASALWRRSQEHN